MTNVCVRIFLERWERNIQYFIQEFQKLTVSDEKVSTNPLYIEDKELLKIIFLNPSKF